MGQKKEPKTPAKVIKFRKRKKEPEEEEMSQFETLSEAELELNEKVDALAALFSAGEVIKRDIEVLLQEAGLNGEKEAWQDFSKKWNQTVNLFEAFWEVS